MQDGSQQHFPHQQQSGYLLPPRPQQQQAGRTCHDSTSRAELLQQVATIANGVMRLSRKMQTVGLTAGERGLLDLHMSLLERNVVQLQPVVIATNLHTINTTNDDPRDQHADYHSSPNSSDDESSGSSSPQPTSTHTGTPPRRRTKRIFSDRSCQHCDTQYTSQWRTGPSGPSTLCNACGIRYARQVKQERAAQRLQEVKGCASPSLPPAVIVQDSRQPVMPTSAADRNPHQPQSTAAAPNRSSVSFLLN